MEIFASSSPNVVPTAALRLPGDCSSPIEGEDAAFPPAEAAGAAPGSLFEEVEAAPATAAASLLAAALIAPLEAFLRTLPNGVGHWLASSEASLGEPSAEDEAVTLGRLALDAVEDLAEEEAVTIISAMAARVLGRAAAETAGGLEPQQAEALLQAWRQVASALVAARGPEALLRLLPTSAEAAVLTARRS